MPLPEGEEPPEDDTHPMVYIQQFLDQEELDELRFKLTEVLSPGRYEYLMKALAIMANGELSFNG